MIRIFALCSILVCLNVQAQAIELSWGQSVTIAGTTVTCGSSPSCSDAENPYIVCLGNGYQPSTCSVLTNGCNAGQVACLNLGYQPSTCANN